MRGEDGKRYRKRKLKRGVVYEVLLEGKWKSSGESSLEGAMRWVHEREEEGREEKLKDFAKDFYKPGGVMRVRMERRNKERSSGYWLQQQSRLDRYIIKRFGEMKLSEISGGMIDEWLEGLELSGNTKNKLLYGLKVVLREGVRRGIIKENVCEGVECFGEKSLERKPFSEEELERFFPVCVKGIREIWGDLMWGAYFICLADCGHRPGEQSVLLWGDLWQFEGRAGFIIDKSMDAITQQARKTTKTGYSRSSLLSARALKILKEWQKETPWNKKEDLIFSLDGRRGLMANTINKHLRSAAKRAGVDLQGRTAYCFRHTFNTLGILKHHRDDLQFLMGHKSHQETDHYNHPSRQLLIQKALQIKQEA